jgi:superfamily II DNA/RNA helicase
MDYAKTRIPLPTQYNIQHECLHGTFLGIDILCQFNSELSRTRAYILSELTALVGGKVVVLIITNAHEQALKIYGEYERFSRWKHSIRIGVFCDGPSIKEDELIIECVQPTIVVGTPNKMAQAPRPR